MLYIAKPSMLSGFCCTGFAVRILLLDFCRTAFFCTDFVERILLSEVC